jgi:hypothetical protein
VFLIAYVVGISESGCINKQVNTTETVKVNKFLK